MIVFFFFYFLLFRLYNKKIYPFRDPKGKYANCREILSELGVRNATDQDCENVRYVCSVVSRRAAHLASAGIATFLNKMGENNITVGVDGSVYRFHPHFHDLMVEKIRQLQDYKVGNLPNVFKLCNGKNLLRARDGNVLKNVFKNFCKKKILKYNFTRNSG